MVRHIEMMETIVLICNNAFCLESERPTVVDALEDATYCDVECWSCFNELMLRDIFNYDDYARHADSQPAGGARTTKPQVGRT